MSDTINPSGAPQVPSEPPASSSVQPTVAPTAPVPPAPQPAQAPAVEPGPAAGYAPPAAAVPPTGQVPPAGAVPPPPGQMPPFQAQPEMPQNIPGMPLFQLTGGMKFGWAALGLIMGPVAILIAWLTNAHNFPEAKNAAVKFALFGFLTQLLLGVALASLVGCATCAAMTGISGYCYY
ncbi:MAG: spore coat protein SP96 [Slackia faecicanis]|nr:spore coat protein SP96 [Slackia faecicanis]